MQSRHDLTASQLLRALNPLKAACERLEQHHGSLAACHLQLESFLLCSFFLFIDGVTSLVIKEVAVHLVRLTVVVGSAQDSLE